ncbi:arsenic resistance protein [Aquisalimonas sp.]|uniref:arsenic resistance protein n=1 Tax=Aquisalimonas sp. TaxID=1872621 RepID=UPI0025C15CAB|nr:arsenic resistance protein [Aquisalimonas sp.]
MDSNQPEHWQIPAALAALVFGGGFAALVPARAEALEPAVWPVLALLLYATFCQIRWQDLRPAADGKQFLKALALSQAVFVPLMVAVMTLPLPDSPTLKLAILLVLLAPCTDWFVTFTHLGGGSTQQATLATPVLLAGQLVLLPMWLILLAGPAAVDVIAVDRFLVVFAGLIALPLGLALILEMGTRRWQPLHHVAQISRRAMTPFLLLLLFVLAASHLPHLAGTGSVLLGVALLYVAYLLAVPALGFLVSSRLELTPVATRTLIFSLAARNSFVVMPFALTLPEPALAAGVIVVQSVIEVGGLILYTRLIPALVPLQASTPSNSG